MMSDLRVVSRGIITSKVSITSLYNTVTCAAKLEQLREDHKVSKTTTQ